MESTKGVSFFLMAAFGALGLAFGGGCDSYLGKAIFLIPAALFAYFLASEIREDRKKDEAEAAAAEAERKVREDLTTRRESWANHGFLDFKFGMGPSDVLARISGTAAFHQRERVCELLVERSSTEPPAFVFPREEIREARFLFIDKRLASIEFAPGERLSDHDLDDRMRVGGVVNDRFVGETTSLLERKYGPPTRRNLGSEQTESTWDAGPIGYRLFVGGSEEPSPSCVTRDLSGRSVLLFLFGSLRCIDRAAHLHHENVPEGFGPMHADILLANCFPDTASAVEEFEAQMQRQDLLKRI